MMTITKAKNCNDFLFFLMELYQSVKFVNILNLRHTLYFVNVSLEFICIYLIYLQINNVKPNFVDVHFHLTNHKLSEEEGVRVLTFEIV